MWRPGRESGIRERCGRITSLHREEAQARLLQRGSGPVGRPRHSKVTGSEARKSSMLDRSLQTEFEGYRKTLSTADRLTFDERVERLLTEHGIDYVRGYVDALKDTSS